MPRSVGVSILISAALVSSLSVAAAPDVEEEVLLKDGSSVILFEDGGMAMRDARGRSFSMPEGLLMESRDGRVIVMGRDIASRKSRAELERELMYSGG
jgi:hypothetical protein